VFLSVNVCLLSLVAAFDSIEFRYLHDRYLFYVVPLWLVVLFLWLVSAERRPRIAVAIGMGLALLPAVLPLAEQREHTGGWRFNALGSSVAKVVADAVHSDAAARLVLSALGLVLVGSVLLLRARAAPVVVGALTLAFAVNGAAAWATAVDPPQSKVFAGAASSRSWVDERVPPGASVTMLYVPCDGLVTADRLELTSNSFLMTEFFNSSIGPTVSVGAEPSGSTHLDADGSVLLGSGKHLEADYVLAQPGLRVHGRRIAEGTSARLALWHVGGAVGIDGLRPRDRLTHAACAGNGF
jgi:hypothetical protein